MFSMKTILAAASLTVLSASGIGAASAQPWDHSGYHHGWRDRAWERHDRISAISCLSWNPWDDRQELFFELLPQGLNVCAEDTVAFLEQLRRELRGPLTIVWDRHNIHSRSRVVGQWLQGQADVVLEDLPAYAPQVNPDEMVWSWLKYGRLCNLTPHDVAELRDHLVAELQWGQFDKELLRGFFNHAHLGFRL